MAGRKTHVLVEVERVHTRPVDARLPPEVRECLELRRGGREDDARSIMRGQQATQPASRVRARVHAQGGSISVDDDPQVATHQLGHDRSGTNTTKNT